jgi:hypothetical protein
MDIVIRILIVLLWVLFGVTTTTPQTPPITDPEPTFESMTIIETAEVIILESFPPQLVLNVTGYQPDGCDFPVIVRQSRAENSVRVEIFREMPLAVMCPMMLNPYQASIQLDGTFEPGIYTIDVNGTRITVTV